MLRKSRDISISKDDVDLFIKKRIEEEFERKKRAATYLHEVQKSSAEISSNFSSIAAEATKGSKIGKEIEFFYFNKITIPSQKLYVALDFLCEIVSREDASNEIIDGYFRFIKKIIDNDENDEVDVNLEANSNFTPLLLGALFGKVEAMQFLIEKGADAKACTFEGQNILHTAISSQNPFAVLLAIENGVTINQKNIYDNTALNNAVMYKVFNKSIIDLILAAGADLESDALSSEIAGFDRETGSYRNKIAYDILQKHKSDKKILGEDHKIKLAINKVAKLIEMQPEEGKILSPVEQNLLDGFINKSINDVKDLANSPVEGTLNKVLISILDVICDSAFSVESKLDVAHSKSFRELMNIALEFVEKGADVNCKSRNGEFSLLHLASYFDFKEMVKTLVEDHSAEVEEVTSNGSTILHLNALNQNPRALDYIVSVAPNSINSKKKDGDTVLHVAAKSGFTSLVKRLIIKGVDLSLLNNDGDTPLHLATKTGLAKIARILIESGSDVTSVNNSRETPIQCAKKSEEMKEFLAPILKELEAKDKKEKAIKNLPKKMLELKQIAQSKSSKTPSNEKEAQEMLSLINYANSEVNLKTTNNWTPLHIAAKLGQSKIVTDLIKIGFDVNDLAEGPEGPLSVLHCAVQNENPDTLKTVLNETTHSFDSIGKELKYIITSGNRQLLSSFIREESVSCKFKTLTQKERNSFFDNCRTLASKLKSAANAANIKSDINAFAESLTVKGAKEVLLEEVPRPSKKAEKKKIAKENKEIKDKEESEAEAKRIIKEEKSAQKKEACQMSEEDISVDNPIFEDEEIKKKRVYEDKESTQDEAIKVKSENIFPEKHTWNLSAESFIPESERRRLETEDQKIQMKEFLEDPKDIENITDLPPFVQEIVKKLSDQNYGVLLKGSSVYKGHVKDRIPLDLDVEVIVEGMSEWPYEKIGSFVEDKFGLNLSYNHVFKGLNKGQPAFSVNIKDERGLDISFYDSNLMPDPDLSWIVSREKKISFDKESGDARKEMPSAFEFYLAREGIKFNKDSDLLINPNARGLILRLSFLETVGLITREEINLKLAPSINPANPIDLLFKELKMDKTDFRSIEDKDLYIESSINRFLDSHALVGQYRSHFLSNLSDTISPASYRGKPSSEAKIYHDMIRGAVERMQKDETKRPSSSMSIYNQQNNISKLIDPAAKDFRR